MAIATAHFRPADADHGFAADFRRGVCLSQGHLQHAHEHGVQVLLSSVAAAGPGLGLCGERALPQPRRGAHHRTDAGYPAGAGGDGLSGDGRLQQVEPLRRAAHARWFRLRRAVRTGRSGSHRLVAGDGTYGSAGGAGSAGWLLPRRAVAGVIGYGAAYPVGLGRSRTAVAWLLRRARA